MRGRPWKNRAVWIRANWNRVKRGSPCCQFWMNVWALSQKSCSYDRFITFDIMYQTLTTKSQLKVKWKTRFLNYKMLQGNQQENKNYRLLTITKKDIWLWIPIKLLVIITEYWHCFWTSQRFSIGPEFFSECFQS